MLYLVRLPAPAVGYLATTLLHFLSNVLDINLVCHLGLVQLVLAVNARSPLLGSEGSKARGEDEVEDDEEEQEERDQLQPLVSRQLRKPSECLGQRQRLEVARKLDLGERSKIAEQLRVEVQAPSIHRAQDNSCPHAFAPLLTLPTLK